MVEDDGAGVVGYFVGDFFAAVGGEAVEEQCPGLRAGHQGAVHLVRAEDPGALLGLPEALPGPVRVLRGDAGAGDGGQERLSRSACAVEDLERLRIDQQVYAAASIREEVTFIVVLADL